MPFPTKIVLFLISFLLLAAPVHSATPHPSAALEKIASAMDNGDLASFEELVDIDALLDSALNTFLLAVQKPENSNRIPPMLALMFSQAASSDKSGETLRALLKNEARAFVEHGVQSGAFAGKKIGTSQARGLLAPLFANASMARKEIVSVGDAREDGQGWVLPFSVYDHGSLLTYDVVGRFSPTDTGLRLTGIENMDDLLGRISREADAAADQ